MEGQKMEDSRNDIRSYLYKRGIDAALDLEFKKGMRRGQVKPGATVIFWKQGLRWYVIGIDQIKRICRREQEVNSKVGCGCITYAKQHMILQLKNGENLSILISEEDSRVADALYRDLQEMHPELQYGIVA